MPPKPEDADAAPTEAKRKKDRKKRDRKKRSKDRRKKPSVDVEAVEEGPGVETVKSPVRKKNKKKRRTKTVTASQDLGDAVQVEGGAPSKQDASDDKPTDTPTDKPTDEPTDKPADKTSDKPASHSSDAPTAKSSRGSAEKKLSAKHATAADTSPSDGAIASGTAAPDDSDKPAAGGSRTEKPTTTAAPAPKPADTGKSSKKSSATKSTNHRADGVVDGWAEVKSTAKKGRSRVVKRPASTATVTVGLSCGYVPQADGPDTMLSLAAFLMTTGDRSSKRRIGSTEPLPHDPHPIFDRTVEVVSATPAQQSVWFRLERRVDGRPPRPIGEVFIPVEDLVTAQEPLMEAVFDAVQTGQLVVDEKDQQTVLCVTVNQPAVHAAQLLEGGVDSRLPASVTLGLSCAHLPCLDVYSQSDPQIKVYLQPNKDASDARTLCGLTECVLDNPNPVFKQEVTVRCGSAGPVAHLWFHIVEKDQVDEDMGEVMVPLAGLLDAKEPLKFPVMAMGGDKPLEDEDGKGSILCVNVNSPAVPVPLDNQKEPAASEEASESVSGAGTVARNADTTAKKTAGSEPGAANDEAMDDKDKAKADAVDSLDDDKDTKAPSDNQFAEEKKTPAGADKPTDSENSVGVDKSADKSAEVDKSAGADKPTDIPADKPTDKPADNTDKPAGADSPDVSDEPDDADEPVADDVSTPVAPDTSVGSAETSSAPPADKTITLPPASTTSQAPETKEEPELVSVPLAFSCAHLPKMDVYSESDPQIHVWIRDSGSDDSKSLAGSTECVLDDPNPTFQKIVVVRTAHPNTADVYVHVVEKDQTDEDLGEVVLPFKTLQAASEPIRTGIVPVGGGDPVCDGNRVPSVLCINTQGPAVPSKELRSDADTPAEPSVVDPPSPVEPETTVPGDGAEKAVDDEDVAVASAPIALDGDDGSNVSDGGEHETGEGGSDVEGGDGRGDVDVVETKPSPESPVGVAANSSEAEKSEGPEEVGVSDVEEEEVKTDVAPSQTPDDEQTSEPTVAVEPEPAADSPAQSPVSPAAVTPEPTQTASADGQSGSQSPVTESPPVMEENTPVDRELPVTDDPSDTHPHTHTDSPSDSPSQKPTDAQQPSSPSGMLPRPSTRGSRPPTLSHARHSSATVPVAPVPEVGEGSTVVSSDFAPRAPTLLGRGRSRSRLPSVGSGLLADSSSSSRPPSVLGTRMAVPSTTPTPTGSTTPSEQPKHQPRNRFSSLMGVELRKSPLGADPFARTSMGGPVSTRNSPVQPHTSDSGARQSPAVEKPPAGRVDGAFGVGDAARQPVGGRGSPGLAEDHPLLQSSPSRDTPQDRAHPNTSPRSPTDSTAGESVVPLSHSTRSSRRGSHSSEVSASPRHERRYSRPTIASERRGYVKPRGSRHSRGNSLRNGVGPRRHLIKHSGNGGGAGVAVTNPSELSVQVQQQTTKISDLSRMNKDLERKNEVLQSQMVQFKESIHLLMELQSQQHQELEAYKNNASQPSAAAEDDKEKASPSPGDDGAADAEVPGEKEVDEGKKARRKKRKRKDKKSAEVDDQGDKSDGEASAEKPPAESSAEKQPAKSDETAADASVSGDGELEGGSKDTSVNEPSSKSVLAATKKTSSDSAKSASAGAAGSPTGSRHRSPRASALPPPDVVAENNSLRAQLKIAKKDLAHARSQVDMSGLDAQMELHHKLSEVKRQLAATQAELEVQTKAYRRVNSEFQRFRAKHTSCVEQRDVDILKAQVRQHASTVKKLQARCDRHEKLLDKQQGELLVSHESLQVAKYTIGEQQRSLAVYKQRVKELTEENAKVKKAYGEVFGDRARRAQTLIASPGSPGTPSPTVSPLNGSDGAGESKDAGGSTSSDGVQVLPNDGNYKGTYMRMLKAGLLPPAPPRESVYGGKSLSPARITRSPAATPSPNLSEVVNTHPAVEWGERNGAQSPFPPHRLGNPTWHGVSSGAAPGPAPSRKGRRVPAFPTKSPAAHRRSGKSVTPVRGGRKGGGVVGKTRGEVADIKKKLTVLKSRNKMRGGVGGDARSTKPVSSSAGAQGTKFPEIVPDSPAVEESQDQAPQTSPEPVALPDIHNTPSTPGSGGTGGKRRKKKSKSRSGSRGPGVSPTPLETGLRS